jgi:hypothetical protein
MNVPTLKKTAAKLPIEEWNFGDQLKDETNASLVRGVFFYEYFRSSRKLRSKVLFVRRYYFDEKRNLPPKKRNLRPARSGWPAGYNILYPEEKELIRQKTNGWEIVGELVQGLMNNSSFPKISALQLLNYKGQTDGQKDCLRSWFCNLNSSPALRYCKDMADGQDAQHLTQQIVGVPGIEYQFNGSVQARESESVIPVTIDWATPDNQIIADFREVVLGRRPKQFLKFQKVSSQQVAIGILIDKLLFRPRSALEWLGVFRRREAVKTWREYLEIYNPKALQQTKPEVVKSKDISELSRSREEDYRKAKLILDWFENGTALKKEKFK